LPERTGVQRTAIARGRLSSRCPRRNQDRITCDNRPSLRSSRSAASVEADGPTTLRCRVCSSCARQRRGRSNALPRRHTYSEIPSLEFAPGQDERRHHGSGPYRRTYAPKAVAAGYSIGLQGEKPNTEAFWWLANRAHWATEAPSAVGQSRQHLSFSLA
jgi:hypothetical protein